MRLGINLSDKVHAVSPTYVKEIVRPSDPERGFFGGEGLEGDLQRAEAEQRLAGILNGAEYDAPVPAPMAGPGLLELCLNELLIWIGARPQAESTHLIAYHRLTQWRSSRKRQPGLLLTSVGRITDQKVLLLRQILPSGQSVLEVLLDRLAERGRLILLGSGDAELENFLTRVASRKSNFLFLKGYSESLGQHLYSSGDLFLMPSSFEPCGISQMLAMRAGQPCVVHAVGGLKDTIRGNVNGFAFEGDTPPKQAQMFREAVGHALDIRKTNESRWLKIREAARAARFTWDAAAMQYIGELYE